MKNNVKKLFVIAGEASGDLHGANLLHALKNLAPNWKIMGWGGDKMQMAGMTINKHIRELAFMGFWEVIKNLPTILKNFKICKKEILEYKPDAILLIDYPGFNLRLAKWAFEHQIPVFYYISPQLWAWKKGRIKQVKKYVKKLFVILPFEEEFFRKNGFDKVHYVGHPLLDELNRMPSKNEDFRIRNGLSNKPILALLPGSRKQEIQNILPTMVATAIKMPQFEVVIAAAPSQSVDFYHQIIGEQNVKLVLAQTYALLQHAHIAAVASGTATLETALIGVPQVVCYKGNALSFAIAKKLVKVPFISLVNLIANKLVVKELIQEKLKPNILLNELLEINQGEKRITCLKNYEELKTILGNGGASNKVAKSLVDAV